MDKHPGTPANRAQGIPETPYIVRLHLMEPRRYGDMMDIGAFNQQELNEMLRDWQRNPVVGKIEVFER